jgi:predicted nucleotidyltransferase
MSPQQFLEQIFCSDVPPEVTKAFTSLQEHFGRVVMTGSRVIGGWTDTSDFDFVVADNSRHESFTLEGLQGWHEYVNEVRNKRLNTAKTSVYPRINIIVDSRPGALDMWEIATEAAIEAKAITRDERVKIFKEFGV